MKESKAIGVGGGEMDIEQVRIWASMMVGGNEGK